jgi:hypothetical protein
VKHKRSELTGWQVGGPSCNGSMHREQDTTKPLLCVMDVYTRSHLNTEPQDIIPYKCDSVVAEFSVRKN